MNIEEYVGLSKKSAQNKAEAQNLIFRLITIDGEPYLGFPEDVRDDRVCCEIVDGKVAKAYVM
jgi:hypothetical protein